MTTLTPGLPSSRRFRVTGWLLLLLRSVSKACPRAPVWTFCWNRPSPPGHALEDDALEDALKIARRGASRSFSPVTRNRECEKPAAFPSRVSAVARLGDVDVPVKRQRGRFREARWREEGRGQKGTRLCRRAGGARGGWPEAGTEAWLTTEPAAPTRATQPFIYLCRAGLPGPADEQPAPAFPDRLRSLSGKVVLVGATAAGREMFTDAAGQPALWREVAGGVHSGGHGGDTALAGASARRGRGANGCCLRLFRGCSWRCCTGSGLARAWRSRWRCRWRPSSACACSPLGAG